MQNGSKRGFSHPSIKNLLQHMKELVDAGIDEGQLDAFVRTELIGLAAKAEDECGHLLPRSKDQRTRQRSVN